MKGFSFIKPFFSHSCILILFIVFSPDPSHSQRLGIANDDYMRAIGMERDHIVMKNILRNGLIHRIEDKPEAYYEDNAEFFSMVLLLSGVRPEHYYKLEQNGIDVIHAITADVRPFSEQSLLADLVVLGTVTDIIPENREEDGYDITLKIEIIETFKGSAPGDTVSVRQRQAARLPGSDTRPEINESYLFLLSSGMYGYHRASHQFREKSEIVVSPPQFGAEETFVIYRLYPYRDGQLQRSPQNRNAAFNSLRTVDFLLKRK